MEISGKIIAALPARSGTSSRTGNQWKSQEFVIETHDQYPRKCVFTVFGEDRLKEFNIEVGKEMTVSFDLDAHEYNGRWFNDIRAWRAVPVSAEGTNTPAATAPAQAIPTPTTVNEAPADFANGSDDPANDLPF